MKLLGTLAILSVLLSVNARATEQRDYFQGYNSSLKVYRGIFRPTTTPIADVVFLHGYGDTFTNHRPLFEEWTKAGLRVIAFDLASHGRTYGGEWDDLDWFSFTDLAELTGQIEKNTIEDPNRPLILAGWSTGGLLAVRMVQSSNLMQLSRNPSGLILFAPAVSVPVCVGNNWCQITNETLTHDNKLRDRKISPPTPLLRVNFAAKLLTNTHLAWNQSLPAIPVLTLVGGNREDKYVNTPDLKNWIRQQRSQSNAKIVAFQCNGARHELDN